MKSMASSLFFLFHDLALYVSKGQIKERKGRRASRINLSKGIFHHRKLKLSVRSRAKETFFFCFRFLFLEEIRDAKEFRYSKNNLNSFRFYRSIHRTFVGIYSEKHKWLFRIDENKNNHSTLLTIGDVARNDGRFLHHINPIQFRNNLIHCIERRLTRIFLLFLQ